MDEPRLLPHLATACCALLGDENPENIPTPKKLAVAIRAGVGEPTVTRFLRGERVPRSRELDQMVSAVAATANADWLQPWRDAIKHAEDAKVEWARFLSGDLPIAPEKAGEPGGEKLQSHRR